MSDTDVYRVVWHHCNGFIPADTRSHPGALYPSLTAAKSAKAYHSSARSPYEGFSLKIQKLERAYGTPLGDDTGLEWVDVDA